MGSTPVPPSRHLLLDKLPLAPSPPPPLAPLPSLFSLATKPNTTLVLIFEMAIALTLDPKHDHTVHKKGEECTGTLSLPLRVDLQTGPRPSMVPVTVQCPALQCTLSLGYQPMFSPCSHLMVAPTVLTSRNRAHFTVVGSPLGDRATPNHILLPARTGLPPWLLRALPRIVECAPRPWPELGPGPGTGPKPEDPPLYAREAIAASRAAHTFASLGLAHRQASDTCMEALRTKVAAAVAAVRSPPPSEDHPCLYISFANFTVQGHRPAKCDGFEGRGAVGITLTPTSALSDASVELDHGAAPTPASASASVSAWTPFAHTLLREGCVCVPLAACAAWDQEVPRAARHLMSQAHAVCTSAKPGAPRVSVATLAKMDTCSAAMAVLSRALASLADCVTLLAQETLGPAMDPSTRNTHPLLPDAGHRSYTAMQDTVVLFSPGLLGVGVDPLPPRGPHVDTGAPAPTARVDWSTMRRVWDPLPTHTNVSVPCGKPQGVLCIPCGPSTKVKPPAPPTVFHTLDTWSATRRCGEYQGTSRAMATKGPPGTHPRKRKFEAVEV